jgi:hypothetical protein
LEQNMGSRIVLKPAYSGPIHECLPCLKAVPDGAKILPLVAAVVGEAIYVGTQNASSQVPWGLGARAVGSLIAMGCANKAANSFAARSAMLVANGHWASDVSARHKEQTSVGTQSAILACGIVAIACDVARGPSLSIGSACLMGAYAVLMAVGAEAAAHYQQAGRIELTVDVRVRPRVHMRVG